MKSCSRCRRLLPPDDFNRSTRSPDGLQSYCRACQRAHYALNSVRHRANVRRNAEARKARMRQLVVDAMRGGCVDCGIDDIRVLEFDHVRGAKVNGIGTMIREGRGESAVLAEMQKCEVRCRNCHALATLARLGRSWHEEFV